MEEFSAPVIAEIGRITLRIDVLKKQLDNAPNYKMNRERELVGVLQGDIFTLKTKEAYQAELEKIRKDRKDIIVTIKKSIDELVEQMVQSKYVEHCYNDDGRDHIKNDIYYL